MGVSFETCLRRCGDVPMGRRRYVPMRRHHDIPKRRREDVPLRRLGDVLLTRRWVLHLRRSCDVTGTYRETSIRRHHDVVLPGVLTVTSKLVTASSGFNVEIRSFSNRIDKKAFLKEKHEQWQCRLRS